MTYAAANLDPEVFPDPHTFVLNRPNVTSHLGLLVVDIDVRGCLWLECEYFPFSRPQCQIRGGCSLDRHWYITSKGHELD